MKKTLLATAIAGALVASGAQAATLYDQDGTKLDIYGRIALGIQGGGDKNRIDKDGVRVKNNGTEFVNVFSRFGLRGTQRVTSDLTAFGNFELRPKLNEVNDDGQQVRNSYLGLRSNTFGTIQAGNFDSFYLDAVSAPFDVYIDRGLEFTGGSHQARGNSLGYISPEMSGFQVYLMGKHYTGNGLPNDPDNNADNSSEINVAGGATYELDGLRLGLGFAQDKGNLGEAQRAALGKSFDPNKDLAVVQKNDKDKPNGYGKNIYGFTAAYEFTDAFSSRIGYEYQKNNRGVFGIGATAAIPDTGWSFNADYYHISMNGDNKEIAKLADSDTTRNAWAGGAYYAISDNFDVFAEVHQADQNELNWGKGGDNAASDLRSIRDSVYWLTGARYFF